MSFRARSCHLPALAVAALLCSGCATTFSRTRSRGDMDIPVSLRAVIGGHARDVMVTDAEVLRDAKNVPHMKAHLLYTHIWSGQQVSAQPFKWKVWWIDPSGRERPGKEGMQGAPIDTRNGLDAKSVSPVENPTGVVIDIDTGHVTINAYTGNPMWSVGDLFSPDERPGAPLKDPLDPWLHPPRLSPAAVVTNVVETYVEEPPSPEPSAPAPYDITTVKPYKDGKAVFRLAILDDSAFEKDILRDAKAEVERTVGDSFAADSPDADVEVPPVTVSVNRLKTADGTRAFRLTGRVVSTQNDLIGWNYDARTRRGSLRFRAGSSADARKIKAWAAKHVEAIVADKGTAVEVGQAPPPGAKYRMLADEFKDGVLTVSFEVIR